MGLYKRHFGATLQTTRPPTHLKNFAKSVTHLKVNFYANKKILVWFSQIEKLETYKFVLTIFPHSV